MHKITVYAAGTDTRNQFTTPPDTRVVADLVAIHQNGNSAGTGGTIAAQYNHTSSGSWVRADFGSGDKVTDDGNWNGTYDCWVPPSAFFDDAETIYVDIPWVGEWFDVAASSFTGAAQAATRASLGAGSVLAEYNGYFRYNASDDATFGVAMSASGVIPAVPLTTGQTVEFRFFQNTGGNQTIRFRWGVRTHHAV